MRSMTCSPVVVALIGTVFLLTGCTDSPVSPSTKPSGDAQISTAAQGAERFTYRIDVPFDWVLTPEEYPCLTEAIQLSGTYQEHLIIVENPSSRFHFTVHQTTNNITVVGHDDGRQVSLQWPADANEQRLHLRPGIHAPQHQPFRRTWSAFRIFFRTLIHFPFDPATGAVKAEVFKDEVLCH